MWARGPLRPRAQHEPPPLPGGHGKLRSAGAPSPVPDDRPCRPGARGRAAPGRPGGPPASHRGRGAHPPAHPRTEHGAQPASGARSVPVREADRPPGAGAVRGFCRVPGPAGRTGPPRPGVRCGARPACPAPGAGSDGSGRGRSVAGQAEAGPEAGAFVRGHRGRAVGDRLVHGQDVRADRRPVEAPYVGAPRSRSAALRSGSPSRRTAAVARASASSLANSSPAAPWSRTWANASRSAASTGAPADIASTRMIPKLSPPVLGATYRSMLRRKRALSSSLIMPRNSTRERISAGSDSTASFSSPRPATSSRVCGRSARIFGRAFMSTGRPLRGSSMRPMKPMVSPCHSGLGLARAKKSTSTPFGMTTASPPRCSTRVRRAYSLTAIRALIFSRAAWRIEYAATIALERGFEVWKVATIGPCAAQHVSRPSDGEDGSWMWTTSKVPSCSQRRTRAADRKPKFSRATEPLYGTGTARPAETTYGGSGVSSSAGARTETSCPRPIRCSARSRMWNWTPPGTSQEYGQTMPILTGSSSRDPACRTLSGSLPGVEVLEPQTLQHVPVLRVVGDPVGEGVGQRLCHDRRLLGTGT